MTKINAVAYKLKLPPNSAVHPVFHVSQLKLAVPRPISSIPSPCTHFGQTVGSQRFWCGGMVGPLPWPHGRIKSLYNNVFLARLLGDKQVPNKGDVTSQDSDLQGPTPVATTKPGPRRSSRPSKPSCKTTGPEWLRPIHRRLRASLMLYKMRRVREKRPEEI
ncbi:hypothetical protein U9M48_035592 [Paspalum notatum var. saurae]|uniref:Tf2-1-like SH3-like domain-containing protein n=1 Tax=Paspalum notatum var. saurae TaxID=547442 RepID=A0AAQ3UFE8_PASNO